MRAGWKVSTLEDTCEIYQPKTISKKEMSDDGAYPVFGANGVIGRYHSFNHEEPQLLITCRGATCGSVNVSEPKSWITGNAMVVRPKINGLDIRFLEYFCRGGIDLNGVITGAAQPQITRKSLSPVSVPLPPLEEQQRIVAVLDEAFEGLARARAHAEANLQNARELFPQLRNGLLQTGEGWKTTALSDLLERITYGFTNPMPNADKGPYKVTAKNVVGGRIDYDGARRTTPEAFRDLLTDKSRPQVGDVLLTKDGTLGRTAVVDRDGICVNQSVAVLTPTEEIIPEYMSEMLSCAKYQKAMIADAGGTTIKHLYITRVPKITVQFPDLQRQQELLEELTKIRSFCGEVENNAEDKLKSVEELRQSLLQKAFAGELT